MKQIEIGKSYESINGHRWTCIAVDMDHAWLTAKLSNASTAFVFKIDGTNVSQGGGEWNIRFKPEVRWETSRAGVNENVDGNTVHYVFRVSFPVFDGKPDFTKATVKAD